MPQSVLYVAAVRQKKCGRDGPRKSRVFTRVVHNRRIAKRRGIAWSISFCDMLATHRTARSAPPSRDEWQVPRALRQNMGNESKTCTEHGAAVRLSSYNYKLHEDSAKLAKQAKNSCVLRQLNCVIYLGQHKRRSDAPASGYPAHAQRPRLRQTGSVLERPASTPSSTPYRDVYAEDRAAAFPVETAARCRSRSISCVRSARPWRCSFGRRGRDQPRDFLSALRPARAVPAHRRRGDGADKNEATVRLRYHEDAIHEQADRWSRTAVAGRRRWSSAHADGPWCGSTYNCGFYSFEQYYETVRGAGGGPRTSVTAGRQDGA